MKTILIAITALFLLATVSWAKASGTFYFMFTATTGVAQAGPFSTIRACNNARDAVGNVPGAVAVSDCYSAQ
jgi:hypothetical protein